VPLNDDINTHDQNATSTEQDGAMPDIRIKPLPADDPIAIKYGNPPGRTERPHNIFRVLAHNEQLLKSFSRLGGYLLRDGAVPAREREIVILRTGWRCGSEYEFGHHVEIGAGVGLDDDAVRRLTADGYQSWPDDDAALLRMADELCEQDMVSDATWQALSRRWDAGQLVELLMLAGFYRMVSGTLNSAGVELEAGVRGWPAGVTGRHHAPREA
jgi:4-carboxymuconolactone decarboxylase